MSNMDLFVGSVYNWKPLIRAGKSSISDDSKSIYSATATYDLKIAVENCFRQK